MIENAALLAGAVIKRAILDYKGCLRRYKTLDEYRESSSLELKELEAFFRSSWCDILCELCGYESGEGIMLQCKKEAMKIMRCLRTSTSTAKTTSSTSGTISAS